MGNILRAKNGNTIVLVPRSGSHSLSLSALMTWWPDQYFAYLSGLATGDNWHPAAFFPIEENWDNTQAAAIIVRNPMERFLSMVSHKELNLEEQLLKPIYQPIPSGNFIRYFKFETQLNECAAWLGLPTPLIHEDQSDPNKKPNLTSEQESIVRIIYAKDIELWESLNA